MNILLLAAGGKIIDTESNGYPLTLMEFNGRPLIQYFIEVCLTVSEDSKLIIAFRNNDIKRFYLDNIVRILAPNAKIVAIENSTKGAACTALLAASYIDNDEELLILNANDYLQIELNNPILHFREKKLDAGTVIFDSIHPRYSYVKLLNDIVVEAAEKRPISHHATAGYYWFKNGFDFVKAAKNMIYKNASFNEIFYICPVFNELILDQKVIGVYPIDKKLYLPIKSKEQISEIKI